MPDLSVIIPARNEEWLQRTIDDILQHAEADTEVIAVLDGEWADPPVQDHPRVRVTHSAAVLGQRAATNLGAAMSRSTYLMKLDAHCSLDQGFDRKLIEADREIGRPDVTQIPAMKNLHAFNWKCKACGVQTYQGPTPTVCIRCAKPGPFERVMYWDCKAGGTLGQPWDGGREVRSEFWRFDHTLHFQYHHDYKRRPAAKGELVDVMSSIGCCFFMRRDRFFELGGLDEAAGSWGSYGVEIACKSWLSGGRHIVNRRTWIAHLFRTQGGDFGFCYPNPGSAVERARQYTTQMWMQNAYDKQVLPLSWLIEKFAPLPGWHDPEGAQALESAMKAGAAFALRQKSRALFGRSGGGVPLVATGNTSAPLSDPSTKVSGDRQEMSSLAVSHASLHGCRPVTTEDVLADRAEPQMGGITAVRPVACDVIEHSVLTACGDALHKPDVEQSVDASLWARGSAGRESDAAVAGGMSVSGPQPAAGLPVNDDLGEDARERLSVEMRDREKLSVSHGVTSSEGCDVVRADAVVAHRAGPPSIARPSPSKGLCYYTDGRLDDDPVGHAVRARLRAAGLPLVAVSLKPIAFGDRNIVMPGERGQLMMFRQILAGLEALDTDIAFLVEHDVLYAVPDHFAFTPPSDQVFYYNQHRWQVSARDGRAVHYRASQTSGCCAYRELLVEHYRKRVAHVEAHGWDRNLGYEPGCNRRSREIDPHGSATWMSAVPNIDVRDVGNLSRSKWSIADFRNKANAIGWTEGDGVPGWGRTRGRFAEFLAALDHAALVG